eukprot:jgi/Botrbrau1/4683/Bobra.0218s0005.1
MCAMLTAKFDFTTSVKLVDVLRALRTSRFGLESTAKPSKDSRTHAGNGHTRYGPSTRGGFTPRGGSTHRGSYQNRGGFNHNRHWQADGPTTPNNNQANSNNGNHGHDNKRRRTAFQYLRENKGNK